MAVSTRPAGSTARPASWPIPPTGLADALVRLSHTVQQVFGDASRRHDLTPAQAQLLCRLTQGPVGMTELSRALNLEKSSLTGLVDRVERRGLAVRSPDARDRRACQVELTSVGARLARACHEDITSRLEVMLGDLTAQARELLQAVIGEVVAAYGEWERLPRNA